jgi:hypothetical protein
MMKTQVSPHSIANYRTIGATMAEQDIRVLAVMQHGRAYTRRELGVLAGIENSAAARCVNGLVKAQRLEEVGTKECQHTGRNVGAVALSLADGA